MFTLLSAILWLGNVQLKLKHAHGGGDDTVEVISGPALSTAARLLGVPEAALVKALSKRNISAGHTPDLDVVSCHTATGSGKHRAQPPQWVLDHLDTTHDVRTQQLWIRSAVWMRCAVAVLD